MKGVNLNFLYNEGKSSLIVRMDDYGPAVKIPRNQIENMITEGVQFMISARDGGDQIPNWYRMTGDSFIFISWEEDDLLSILVTTPRQRGEVQL